jgi:hypothetical protein
MGSTPAQSFFFGAKAPRIKMRPDLAAAQRHNLRNTSAERPQLVKPIPLKRCSCSHHIADCIGVLTLWLITAGCTLHTGGESL